jgi:hypothetical protein
VSFNWTPGIPFWLFVAERPALSLRIHLIRQPCTAMLWRSTSPARHPPGFIQPVGIAPFRVRPVHHSAGTDLTVGENKQPEN